MKREIINSDYEMRLASLWEVQSATGEELRRKRALLPFHKGMICVLDKAFKGKL